MLASFHNIKEMILENVEKRERNNGETYYAFTLEIRDDNDNTSILTFFSNDKDGLNFKRFK
tara:strand:+ start:96 stop:278 length:183 start_codon:yes stop_codon:yes gene_type:complete